MTRRRLEPACPRCGNEQDLMPWMNGRVYCAECLRCPHGTLSSQVCPPCIQALYTRTTFQGPRIVDLEIYVRDAWRDYGVGSFELAGWVFHETDAIFNNGQAWTEKEGPHPRGWRVQLPPPHHRVSPWDGSR